MRNRAKCRLCKDIIESFHRQDFVECSCGEISIDGGRDTFKCGAKDWKNFLRVDDLGNEIVVKAEGEELTSPKDIQASPPNKEELIKLLQSHLDSIEALPPHAMTTPINHYDFASLLILLLALFRSDCKDES